MSRHRNIRNLEEEDYYDDDEDYYDEDYDDGGYYDDDDYYVEQQREKERKAKEEAAKKAKANQLKQQQIQKEKQKALEEEKRKKAKQQQQQQQKQKSLADKKQSQSQSSSSNGGISLVSNKKSSISPGFSVETTKKCSNNHTNSHESSQEIPQIPPAILQHLQSNTLRQHLSLVILGHVDTGKSTLTGRLLLQLQHVSSRLLAKYQKASSQIGKSSFALAWFTDEDESERERGVTIDVGTKFARLDKCDLTLLDAPGHRDFVPNMISGAASADCGLLVVAATTGEFEAGFAGGEDGGGEGFSNGRMGGQTREHIVLSRGLGVNQLVVAINKLDAAEPPWSKDRFDHIKATILPFLLANNFKPKQVRFVPVSGLTGVNVAKDCQEDKEGWKALKTWYEGPTLIEALDSFNPPKREFEKPMRLIVTDVSSEGKNVTVRGRVVQGFIRASDNVMVFPVGDEASVLRIERGKAAREEASPYSFAAVPSARSNNGEESKSLDVEDIPEMQNCALAGDTVEVTLSGIDAMRLSPGCVICHRHPTLRPHVKRRFQAKLVVMDRLAVPIIRGSQMLFHMHSIDVPAVLNKLLESTNRASGVTRSNPRVLPGGSSATVEITVNERLVMEEYNECRSLGRFVLRRGGDTVAVGLIDKVLS